MSWSLNVWGAGRQVCGSVGFAHLLSWRRVQVLGLQLIAKRQRQLSHLDFRKQRERRFHLKYKMQKWSLLQEGKKNKNKHLGSTFLSRLQVIKSVAANSDEASPSPLQTATSCSARWAANSWPKSCEAVSHTQQWGYRRWASMWPKIRQRHVLMSMCRMHLSVTARWCMCALYPRCSGVCH